MHDEAKTPPPAEPPVPQPDPKDQKIEELTNALARAMADLANFKRRTEEERGRFVKAANRDFISSLLPIVDNFHRSWSHLPQELKENEWIKGVLQIHDGLEKTLTLWGVKRMETNGQKLDPKRHQVIMAGPGEKDVITEEFEPGYWLGEDVLKPATVKIGDGSKATVDKKN